MDLFIQIINLNNLSYQIKSILIIIILIIKIKNYQKINKPSEKYLKLINSHKEILNKHIKNLNQIYLNYKLINEIYFVELNLSKLKKILIYQNLIQKI